MNSSNSYSIRNRNKAGKTPLMITCQNGNNELFEILLKSGANIHATATLGDTALIIAQKNGFHNLSLKLLEKGASIRNKRPLTSKIGGKIA